MRKATKPDPILCELFLYLCKFHRLTARQILRLFPDLSESGLDTLLQEYSLAGWIRLKYLQLPTADAAFFGGNLGKTKCVETIILTSKARNWIAKNIFDLKLYTKRPSASKRLRTAYHDLLCVEAYLYIHRNHVVEEIFNEDDLREAGENLADLRLLINENGKMNSLDCEVMVQNKRIQLEGKDRDMYYFSPSQRQIDKLYG